MRAVFVRRRAESRATPAWMGGLNYEDHGAPKLPWNIDKRALSSDLASALQTRVHTGASDEHLLEGVNTPRTTMVQSRPHTSGRTRVHSARAPSAGRAPLSARDNRPQTAGGFVAMPSHRQSHQLGREKLRPVSARAAIGVSSHLPNRTAGSAVASTTTSSENDGRMQAHRFFTMHVNILGVGGNALRIGADDKVDSESGFYNACVSLAVDGTSDGAGQTHVSKPFKFCEVGYIAVPENWVHFDLTGNINRMLLCVKMLRKTADSHRAGEAGVQMGSCLVDLGAVLKAGGSKMEVCKLTHDKMGKHSLEVHLQLQMQARTRDFDYEWDDVAPIFKKAGYVITATAGIQAPQSFVARKDHQRKVTKRQNLNMQDLLVTETVNDRPPVVVSRACRLDEAGKETRETYTLKRFPVMEADPRRQLVAELDGLLEMPPHLVVQPVDAFMDKLDAVLVLDDEGGRYLSESVSKLGAMPERLVSIVVRQVLSALVYIHNEKMRVHNNITPANLLVLRTGELKIGGFSFSSKAFMGHTSCKFAGDYAHMAPERLLGLECGFKADVWSVGILTLELLIGASPYDMARFTGPTAIFDFKKVVIQEPSPALRRGGEHTEDARLFVDSCLNKNLKLRADCKALLVQQMITKWEVLTPNYVSRWLNKSKKKGNTGDFESPNRGMASPLNGAQDSPTTKDVVSPGDLSGKFLPG